MHNALRFYVKMQCNLTCMVDIGLIYDVQLIVGSLGSPKIITTL